MSCSDHMSRTPASIRSKCADRLDRLISTILGHFYILSPAGTQNSVSYWGTRFFLLPQTQTVVSLCWPTTSPHISRSGDSRPTGHRKNGIWAISPHTWLSCDLLRLAEASFVVPCPHKSHWNSLLLRCPRGMFPKPDLFQRLKRKWKG